MSEETTGTVSGATALDKEIAEQEALKSKRQAILRELLDERLAESNHLLVTKSKMGLSESWLGTASLGWIRDNVSLFTRLPLFREKIDKQGNFIVDESTVEELRQRTPNWSRQPILVHYLLRHESRTFPPIIVVAEEPWVNDPKAPEWGPDDRATKTSVPVEAIDGRGNVGVIDVADTTVYVIDGSHRWVGIDGALELLQTGQLSRKRKDGAPTGKPYTLDGLMEEYNLSSSKVANLARETMGVEFIPAVMKGETRDEARRRIRSVFVHVNKAAQSPSAGEQVLLDEDDGFSIIARKMALGHRLLRRRNPGDRVNWKSSALPAGSIWLTTGKTLRDLAEQYLSSKEPYRFWRTKAREIAMRPPEEDLERGIEELNKLFDHMAELPSFEAIVRGDDVDDWREFPDRSEEGKGGRGHLLMRPVGQLILANAVGHLALDENGPQLDLDHIFDKLRKFDEEGGFEGVDLPSSVWYGVTYSPQRGTMIMQGRHIAETLMRHLIDGVSADERETLLKGFREARTISEDEKDPVAFDYDGTNVKDPNNIKLPPMI